MHALRWLVTIGLVAVAVSCGGDGGGRDAATTSSTTPTSSATSEHHSGPGTEIGFGLVVPDGAQLVARPFVPPEGTALGVTLAILDVTGDPLAVWDDLVEQTSMALDTALPTTGICQWRSQETAADQVSVHQPRPNGANGFDCDGYAIGLLPDGAGGLATSMRLWWTGSAAEVALEFRPEPSRTEASPYPGVDPGPAPASVRDALPTIERVLPGPGEPFGQSENCFEAGYHQFQVPSGAELLGGDLPGTPVVGILAVDDPEATLREFLDQLEGGDGRDEGEYVLEQREGADGPYWVLDGHIPAGGGSCTIWSTPDGYVVVTAHSD